MILLTLVVHVVVARATGHPRPSSSMDPFYAEPVFDGAHDAEFVWNEEEQCWWMTYLQNRYNSPVSDPSDVSGSFAVYTDIGLASTPDNGTTWIYRGIARGVDVPLELRRDKTNLATQMFGGATWWRPAVLRRGHIYHGFWVYWEPMFAAANQRRIVHYTSTNLKDWSFDSVVPGDRGYDSVVYQLPAPDKRYILLSSLSPGLQAYQSLDLYKWDPVNGSIDAGLNMLIGEGPHVLDWQGYRWLNSELNTDWWLRATLSRSGDGGHSWTQPELWVTPFNQTNGTRKWDIGTAHQGPITLQGPGANKAFYLYFTEFALDPAYGQATGLYAGARSMLQLAAVTYDAANKTLHADRNAFFDDFHGATS